MTGRDPTKLLNHQEKEGKEKEEKKEEEVDEEPHKKGQNHPMGFTYEASKHQTHEAQSRTLSLAAAGD